jgi:hypothetical protein
MELLWVTPPAAQRSNKGKPGIKDLDLAVRFHVPRQKNACEASSPAHTPPRGRSATRCQITASSGSPVQTSQESPTKEGSQAAEPTTRASSQMKSVLLSCIADHISSTQPELQVAGSLAEVLKHPGWDCSACEPVKPADLPPRPRQLLGPLSDSRGATPVRCGSAASILTPSPSIRHRNFSPHVLPSPQATSTALLGLLAPGGCGSEPPVTPSSKPPHITNSALDEALGGLVDKVAADAAPADQEAAPVRNAKSDLRRVLFTEAETPHHAAPATTGRVSQTPGKRKRDVSLSPVTGQTPSVASTAFLKTPHKTPFRTPCKAHQTPAHAPHSSVKAQRTPARSCASQPASACTTPLRTPGKACGATVAHVGSASSPAVRRQLMAMSSSSMFADRLPHVCTPKAKRAQSAHKTPVNDALGSLAHCSAHSTPASAKSAATKGSLRKLPSAHLSAKRSINFHAAPATTTATAAAFYSSPSKSSVPKPEKQAQLHFKVAPPHSGMVEGGIKSTPDSGHEKKRSSFARGLKGAPGQSDAACLAASIMDDDMLQLLQRNEKRSAATKIAQRPENVKKAIERVRAYHPVRQDAL